jgi:hypothetical protein
MHFKTVYIYIYKVRLNVIYFDLEKRSYKVHSQNKLLELSYFAAT